MSNPSQLARSPARVALRAVARLSASYAALLIVPGCVELDPNAQLPDIGPAPTMPGDAGSPPTDAGNDGAVPDGGEQPGAPDAMLADSASPLDASDTAADAATSAACLPFDPPALETLRASPHKVFAHYFAPFPISIDNLDAARDYYTAQYLAPSGESGKWQFCGGYLRDRPIPRGVSSSASWFDDDYTLEIQRARAIGLDGFTFDILASSGPMWERLDKMLSAAERTDPSFRIALMPDMYGAFLGSDSTATATFVDAMASVITAHPSSVFHLDDGRAVIAPYGAEQRSNAWWKTTLQALNARGVPSAFVPLFSNVPFAQAMTSMTAQGVALEGVASWGTRTPDAAPALQQAVATAHDAGLLWMAPVAPQDARPKELVYWEAKNSENFRRSWQAAIDGGADWVQLITWNDYSESSHVAPSEVTGYVFADLSAYYTTWFKTGSAPAVLRDRLYYLHRAHAMSATPKPDVQTGGNFRSVDGAAAANEIELIAFLKAPGTLQVSIDGRTTNTEAPAGLSTLRVPLAEGTPRFQLLRAGTTVISLAGSTSISNVIALQDPLYHGGSSPRCAP